MRALLSCLALLSCALVSAAEPASRPAAVAAAKPELYLILPEPRVMGGETSKPLGGAQHTVFTAVRQSTDGKSLEKYTQAELTKLGISWDSFLIKAQATADRQLAQLVPEFVKDEKGQVRYAVYRGAKPIYASLLVAPSLPKIFEKTLGKKIWLAAPDRHALYIFPADSPEATKVASDLAERFESDPFSASEEIFFCEMDKPELRATAVFTSR